MQSDLQKLIGFETRLHLKSEDAFMEHLSRFEKLRETEKIASEKCADSFLMYSYRVDMRANK